MDPSSRRDALPIPRRAIAWARSLGRRGRAVAAVAIYTFVAVGYFAGEILFDLASRCAGVCAPDTRFYLWALRWVPYALGHGEHPLFSTVIWAPHGIDLSFVASIPGPAVVMTPVTLSFGPLAASNLLLLASPILAAWGAYLLCGRVVDRFWPSVVGGAVFGFSSYVLHFMGAQINLTLIFPAAFAAYLVARRVQGDIGPRAFVVFMALLLLIQVSISSELFATLTFFGAIALVIAVVGGPEIRRPLLRTCSLLAVAYAIVGVLLLPYVLNVLEHAPEGPIRPLDEHAADLLSFIRPPEDTIVAAMPDYLGHPGAAYLGVGFVTVLLLAFWEGRHRAATPAVAAFLLVTAMLSLGPTLLVAQEPTIPLPGALVERLPLLHHSLPNRYPAYLWLALAPVVAVWLAGGRGRARWLRYAIVALAFALILPNLDGPRRFHGRLSIPSFFTDGTYRRYLQPGEIVFTVGRDLGDDLTWQVETEMYFRLAHGYVGAYPHRAGFVRVGRALTERVPRRMQLARVLRARDVTAVVIVDPAPEAWTDLLAQLTGSRPVVVGGVRVYRLAAPSTG